MPGFTYANIGQTVQQANGDYAPWNQQSTWVYEGEIYFGGNANQNKVTFYWNIDDAAMLKIDGTEWQGQGPSWTSGDVTGTLTTGWHTIEWRGSNNGGPGGATGGIGFGWDPSGGNNIVAMPTDPGDGSLYQTGVSTALPSGTALSIGTAAPEPQQCRNNDWLAHRRRRQPRHGPRSPDLRRR